MGNIRSFLSLVDNSVMLFYADKKVIIMANRKSNINVSIDADVKELIAERRLSFQPVESLSLDEQIVAAALKRNPKRVSLPTDENGNVLIDKEKYPDIYDWAANG
jgi:hypothetical protein